MTTRYHKVQTAKVKIQRCKNGDMKAQTWAHEPCIPTICAISTYLLPCRHGLPVNPTTLSVQRNLLIRNVKTFRSQYQSFSFTDTEVLKNVAKHLGGGDLSACYIGEMGETEAQILTDEVGGEGGCKSVDDSDDGFIGTYEGVVVAG